MRDLVFLICGELLSYPNNGNSTTNSLKRRIHLHIYCAKYIQCIALPMHASRSAQKFNAPFALFPSFGEK